MKRRNITTKYNLQVRLNQLRTKKEITENQIKTETRTLYELFGRVSRMGDKVVGMVPLYLINCDNSYQVPQLVNPAIVDYIASSYDPRISEPIKLCIRDYEGGEPGFWVPDGRHRTLDALERGDEYIFADIFVVSSKADEINIFQDQYRNKNRLKAYGKFNALLIQGDETAVTVHDVCAAHDIKIPVLRIPKVVNQVTCTSTLLDTAKNIGKEGLDFIFNVLREAYMDNDYLAYTRDMILTVAYAYRHFGAECYTTLVSVLKGRSVEAFKADAKSKYKEKKMREAMNTYVAYCVDRAQQRVVSIA